MEHRENDELAAQNKALMRAVSAAALDYEARIREAEERARALDVERRAAVEDKEKSLRRVRAAFKRAFSYEAHYGTSVPMSGPARPIGECSLWAARTRG